MLLLFSNLCYVLIFLIKISAKIGLFIFQWSQIIKTKNICTRERAAEGKIKWMNPFPWPPLHGVWSASKRFSMPLSGNKSRMNRPEWSTPLDHLYCLVAAVICKYVSLRPATLCPPTISQRYLGSMTLWAEGPDFHHRFYWNNKLFIAGRMPSEHQAGYSIPVNQLLA